MNAATAVLMATWVRTIMLNNELDISVVGSSPYLAHVECSFESKGQESSGWPCLFRPIPHMCTFDSREVSKKAKCAANL